MADSNAAELQIETDRNQLLLRAGFPETALPKPGFEKRRLGAFDAYVGLQYLAAFGCWNHFRDLCGGEIYPADSAVALNNKRAMEWNKILFRAYDRQEMDDLRDLFCATGGGCRSRCGRSTIDPLSIRPGSNSYIQKGQPVLFLRCYPGAFMTASSCPYQRVLMRCW